MVAITDIRAALRLRWLQRSAGIRAETRKVRVHGHALPALD
jgi:hypothetical protein